MNNVRKLIYRFASRNRFSLWLGQLGVAIAVGVAYFFAAQFSLVLLTKPDGVAVFWPAASISSGALIALGPRALVPVVVAVVCASTVASLFGDRSLAAASVFALCNAGEPLIVAWLIRRHFGESFRLENLRSVLGFFMAAAAGPAISGILATVGFILFYSSAASFLTTWLNWFSSDALGIIMVAPLLIGIASIRGDPPERWEVIEGTFTLVALIAVSAIALGSTQFHWYIVFPLAVLLPILLAAHCRPVFAAAAALILGFAVVWTTTFGIGSLGELPDLHDRAYAARSTLIAIATCTLLLAALFAELRQKSAALEDAKHRLELALDGAELGVWTVDTKTGRFESDARNARIHGYSAETPPEAAGEARRYIYSDDLAKLDAALRLSSRHGGRCRSDYRLASDRERWVSVEGTLVRTATGQPVRWLGVTRDISEQKKAALIAQRLVSIVESSDDAIISTDVNGTIVSWNEGAERLFGYSANEIIGKPVSVLIPPDRHNEERAILGRIQNGHPVDSYETVRCRRDGTLVDVSLTISPLRNADGAVIGASKIARDVTVRKRAEEHRRLLNAELDHRVKNTLAIVSAVIDQTEEAASSLVDFASGLRLRITSLASTHEMLSRGQWRGVSLLEIARRAFAPYIAHNTIIDGPSVTLKTEAAQAVAMVLHELTTNAAKYGGFSTPSGGVQLRWNWLHNGSSGPMAIEWQEIGGPRVIQPTRFGYGTAIVRELIPFELAGTVDLSYPSDGLRCRLEIPAEWVSSHESPQVSDAAPGMGV